MVPCKSTAKEVSFEWSHHRISSPDSKVRTTLQVSKIDHNSDSGIERVKIFSLGCNSFDRSCNQLDHSPTRKGRLRHKVIMLGNLI